MILAYKFLIFYLNIALMIKQKGKAAYMFCVFMKPFAPGHLFQIPYGPYSLNSSH